MERTLENHGWTPADEAQSRAFESYKAAQKTMAARLRELGKAEAVRRCHAAGIDMAAFARINSLQMDARLTLIEAALNALA